MKKFLSIITLVLWLNSFLAQDFHILKEGAKYGVQDDQGNWIINPVYEDIVPYLAEKKYYMLFLEKGRDFTKDNKFITCDSLGQSLFGSSKFLIADDEFYVMSVTAYSSIRKELRSEKSDYSLIYLTHTEGQDYINVDKNQLIEMGYVSSFEQRVKNHFLVQNGNQYGFYSIAKEIYLLETFYEEILFPHLNASDSDKLLQNSPDLHSNNHKLVVRKRGKTGVYDYEKDVWNLEMERGDLIHVLKKDFSELILEENGTQTLYVNGLARATSSFFVLSTEETYLKGYTDQYIVGINEDNEYEILDWYGESIVTQNKEIYLYNSSFYGSLGFNGSINIYSFEQPRKKLFNVDYVLHEKEEVNKKFPNLFPFIQEQFLIVKKEDKYGVILSNGTMVMGIDKMDVMKNHLSYSSSSNYGIIDLAQKKVIDIESTEPVQVSFNYHLYQVVYSFKNKEGRSLVQTHLGKIVRPDHTEWKPRKFKEGWNMTPLIEKRALLPEYYKGIKKYYNSDFLMAMVQNEYGWGVVNIANEKIIPLEYEDIYMEFNAYGNPVFFVKLNNLWGLYNYQGKLVLPCKYASIVLLPEVLENYDGEYYQGVLEDQKFDLYTVAGEMMFNSEFDLQRIVYGTREIKSRGQHLTILTASKDNSEFRTIILDDKDDLLYSEIDYYNRYKDLVLSLNIEGKSLVYNIEGALISNKEFDKNSQLIQRMIASKTENGWLLYDLNKRSISDFYFVSFEEKDEFFLQATRSDGAIYYISYEDHYVQSLEEWEKKYIPTSKL